MEFVVVNPNMLCKLEGTGSITGMWYSVLWGLGPLILRYLASSRSRSSGQYSGTNCHKFLYLTFRKILKAWLVRNWGSKVGRFTVLIPSHDSVASYHNHTFSRILVFDCLMPVVLLKTPIFLVTQLNLFITNYFI